MFLPRSTRDCFVGIGIIAECDIVIAATHDATPFRLDGDSIRLENRAFILATEVHRQIFFL